MTRLVRHVMAAEPKVATEDMSAVEGARLMASYDFGMVPVVGTDICGLPRDAVSVSLSGSHVQTEG